MAFTASDVKALRERTGCGMMDCKKALTESNGDMDKAIEFLREKGLAAAAKKSGRIAAEGVVTSVVNNESGVGVILEINSETDFVAKNEEFIKFVSNVANTIIDKNPSDVSALNKCELSGSANTVEQELQDKILTIGENLKIRRFERLEGALSSYVHGNGRIGVIVKFDTDADTNSESFAEFGKSICMQIAASTPLYINKEVVPNDVIAKEKEILLSQALNEGKPQNIAEKMVAGRITKYYKDVCLLEQSFIKNMDISVSDYVSQVEKDLNCKITIEKFLRFEKGEGIEKKEDNFADEVANMVK